jgi:hypothetical protein
LYSRDEANDEHEVMLVHEHEGREHEERS